MLLCGGALACRSKSSSEPAASTAAVAPSVDWLSGTLPPETGTPTDGGTLIVRVMNEPATLNYLDDASHDVWVFKMIGHTVLDTLIELSPSGELKPGLATSWVESSDHLTTTFVLREATFSDGAAFGAADVVATLDALMKGTHATGSARGELATLASWEAVNERSVVLRWASPSAFALRALARLPIGQRAQLAGDWALLGRAPIGTGPFTIESWERGQKLVLKRRGPGAWLDRVVFRFVKDHAAAGAMLERGEFDLMTNVTPMLWRAMEQPDPSMTWAHRDLNRIRSLDNSYSYVGWNERHPALSDVKVRRALAQLYDAKTVSAVIDLGLELPTTCPYQHGSPSCSTTLDALGFDPAAAQATLADAGFIDSDGDGIRERAGQKLEFTFLLPSNSVRLGRLVPLLQEQLRAAGVAMNIERVETTSLSPRVARRDFDVVSRVWTEFDTEQELFQMFHSSQIDGGSNFISYSDREVDRLIEAVRFEFDAEKRRALERALHERLYAQQPYLFMTHRQSLDAAKRRVHGLQPSVAWYDLRRVWVQD